MWFLDLRSGEFIPWSHDPGLNEDSGFEDPEGKPEIFLQIESRPSREGYALMNDFAEDLPEGEARRALIRALGLPKPFRSFKDTLFDFPDEREAWFKFRTARLNEAAIEFLEENSVPWTKKDRGGGETA